MDCPLSQGYRVESKYIEDYEVRRECWGKECAWWDKIMERCAVLSLVDRISALSQTLSIKK